MMGKFLLYMISTKIYSRKRLKHLEFVNCYTSILQRVLFNSLSSITETM